MINGKKIITILCFIFIWGCSSDELIQAEQTYLKAKSTHQINQILTSLQVLTKLAPKKYKPLLEKATQAKNKLQTSKKYIEQKNYYLAYLASHDSLQHMYSIEGRAALEESGNVFAPLLKAKKRLNKYYQHHPLDAASLASYQKSPTLDWNLIELNLLLNKFSLNISTLESSKNIIKAIPLSPMNSLSAEILLIEQRIENQLQRFQLARNYLIDIALYRNAKLLVSANHTLTAENINISQIYNNNRIDKAMQPLVVKTIKQYAPNKNVIENMFISASGKAKKHHKVWFKKWQRLEKEVLEPVNGFVDYALYAQHRNEQLMAYINKEKIELPLIPNNIVNSNSFFQEIKAILELIEKLEKDSLFFDY